MGATPGVLRVDEIAAKPPLCPPLCHLFYFLTEDCMTIEILIGLPFNQYRLCCGDDLCFNVYKQALEPGYAMRDKRNAVGTREMVPQPLSWSSKSVFI